jgi:hypothetical protein
MQQPVFTDSLLQIEKAAPGGFFSVGNLKRCALD